MFSLKGELAVVSGSSGRLGPIWAKALADAGADVALVDVGNNRNQCGGMIGTSVTFLCYPGYDISELDQVKRVFGMITKEWGRVPSILVNNAGIDSRPTDVAALHDTFHRMVHVNVLGTYQMTKVFGDAMAAEGHGSIVNIASLYGLCSPDLRLYEHREDGWVKDPMYGATKAAIISMTKYYAAKWGKQGVRVNALAPGGVVAHGDSLTAQDPQFVEKYTAKIPMGRMAQPDDLGGPLVFLASRASRCVTGHTIPIDGGFLCL